MNKPRAHLAAMTGHLIDLYRLVAFKLGNPHSYSKFRIINAIGKHTGATTMIETGTFLGVTAARCARMFEKVYTIELDAELARQSADYLRRWPNVEAIRGDGLVETPRVLGRAEVRDVLIFLDGHYSGGKTAHGDVAEPALDELNVISAHREKVRAIIIDEFRLFGAQEGFPRKSELFRSID